MIKLMIEMLKIGNDKKEEKKKFIVTYRIAFTSGEISCIPLWVIWLVIKLFWFGTFDGAGLKSFNIVATDA